jgi:hypothetical protein
MMYVRYLADMEPQEVCMIIGTCMDSALARLQVGCVCVCARVCVCVCLLGGARASDALDPPPPPYVLWGVHMLAT